MIWYKKLNNKQEKDRFTFDSRIDYPLILPAISIIIIGFYALYVALSHDYPTQVKQMMAQQATWAVIGIILAFIVMHLNSKVLWQATPLFYGIGLLLLALPLQFYSPSMYASTGAKNWIAIGDTNLFQPSEFMKVAYILMLSWLIVRFQKLQKERNLIEDLKLLGLMILVTIPIAFLSALQKDFGTFVVFGVIFLGMLFVSGISWKLLLPIFGLGAGLFAGITYLTTQTWGQKLLGGAFGHYQINRFIAWLHPFDYMQGFSRQQALSLISIGSGGLYGKGLNVVSVPVPVRESDMIFTVIAEDFGFVGSVLLVILYFFLIYRMIRATYKSNNAFYIYISTGVIMMFLFHIFENIGAAAGVVPLTGIPLPLVSQGGSALIADIIAIGLVLSMKYNQLPDFATTDQDMKNKLAKKRIQRAKQRQKKKDTDKK